MISSENTVKAALVANIRDNPSSAFSGVWTTAYHGDEPTTFPCLNIDLLGEPERAQSTEMNLHSAIEATYEIKGYTAKTATKAQAKALVSEAADVMCNLGFSMYSGIIDSSTDNYNCYVARFRRVIGSDDGLIN